MEKCKIKHKSILNYVFYGNQEGYNRYLEGMEEHARAEACPAPGCKADRKDLGNGDFRQGEF